jgi:hypothetical protein
VNDVNLAPAITSDGGGAIANLNIAENTTTVTTVTAADADLDNLTYSISGGADGALFSIDGVTGELTFISPPDYEAPADADANNVYEVIVQVADGNGGFDTQTINVTVTDVGGVLAVTTTADTNDGNTSSIEALLANKGADGEISLREAIIAANNTTGADSFSLGAGTFTLSGTELTISDDLSITGAGAGATIIDGASLSRIFNFTSGTVTISDLTITNGDAGAGNGGGIQISTSATVNLDNVALTGNTGFFGGAIVNAGALNLTNVTIANNTATSDAGGIWSQGNNSSLNATNVTISGNVTPGLGGGLYVTKNATLTNVTITNNSASSGAGIYESGGAPNATITNSIIAGNLDTLFNPAADLIGDYISGGNNIIGDVGSASGFTDGVNNDQVGNSATPVDPMLDVLADNGGSTQTHALLAGSSAIDAANDALAPATDQNGNTRSGTADIGAYEYVVVGSAPVITSDGGGATANLNIAENTTTVTTVTATDADLDTLTYSISGGADGALFSIDSSTGDLTFMSPPDYEAPADADANNIYEVIVQVVDGNGGFDTQTINVTVADISNEAPVASPDSATVDQDTTATIDLTANDTDAEGDPITMLGFERVIASYDAGTTGSAPDPATVEGGAWNITETEEGDPSGGNVYAGEVSPDGTSGLNAWNVTDATGNSGDWLYYDKQLSAADTTLADTYGWELSATIRFVEDWGALESTKLARPGYQRRSAGHGGGYRRRNLYSYIRRYRSGRLPRFRYRI